MDIDIKTADGADIKLDTAYYLRDGTKLRVKEICISNAGKDGKASVSLWCKNTNNLLACLHLPSELFFDAPDSWEKLVEDIDQAISSCGDYACSYFGFLKTDCSYCPHIKSSTTCRIQMIKDIQRRIKKLAEVE